jgi:hypothetical protein
MIEQWNSANRRLSQAKENIQLANIAEQFQNIGLLCRDALADLAQSTYDSEEHPNLPDDETKIGVNDAKRMFGAYLQSVLGGSSYKEKRVYGGAAFDLANQLQHRKNATLLDAEVCLEATESIFRLITILENRKQPHRKIEKLMYDILLDLRIELQKDPLVREFGLFIGEPNSYPVPHSNIARFNFASKDNPRIEEKVNILLALNYIAEKPSKERHRFRSFVLTEPFVAYLETLPIPTQEEKAE